MGSFRFRKQFKIAPGVKLNLNKQSVSLTGGVRGAHYTVNSKGYRTASAGIPGTGLSYRDTRRVEVGKAAAQIATRMVVAYVIGLLIGVLILVAICW